MGLFGKKGPPSAEEVAKRALVLACLVGRGLLIPPREMIAQLQEQWGSDGPKMLAQLMDKNKQGGIERLSHLSVESDVTRSEREFFQKPLYRLTEQQLYNASWRTEALRSLLWTLCVTDSPGPFDEESDPVEIVKACTESVSPTSASIRPPDELEAQRTIAEMWHWRSRTRELQERPEPIPLPPEITMEEVIKMSAEMMVQRGAFPSTIGDDFAAMGRPYRDLTVEEWTIVRSITMERHYALNWVCGYAPRNDWDRTPTDT